MIILIAISVISCFLFLMWKTTRKEGWGFAALMVGVIVGGLALLFVFVNRLTVPGEIRQFESVRHTLEVARNNDGISPIELAAIQTEVIKANRWLASSRFYAKNPWTNIFVPKSVLKLKPID